MTRLVRWIGRAHLWVGRQYTRLGHRLCPEPLDITSPDGVRVCVAEHLGGPEDGGVKVLLLARMPDGSTLSFGLTTERARHLYRSLREAATLARTLAR
jgi:hypothetical protein